ncbi:unnamed protein product [Parajaminaea phylloscopi]
MAFGDNPFGQNYATGGGGGGGGFMTGSQTDSPSGRGSNAKHTLRPVTIRQVNNAEQASTDADFRIDGVDLGQLTLVAVVRNISRTATNVLYSVEDGTGTIEVRQWLDSSSDDSEKAVNIRQDEYVRILGTVRAFQQKRSISAGHIRPVDNYNEFLFHKMDVVWTHLQLVNGSSSKGGAGGAAAQAGDFGANTSTSGGDHDFSAISSPVQRKIAQAIAVLAGADTEGITAQQVHSKLPSIPVSTIAKEIEEMVNNGFLYHSVDDEHVLLP